MLAPSVQKQRMCQFGNYEIGVRVALAPLMCVYIYIKSTQNLALHLYIVDIVKHSTPYYSQWVFILLGKC
jgi:hypothetical protein